MTTASNIAYQACNLYDKKPKEIEGSFTMYSHDRFASLIIKGIAEQMLEDGCSEAQIKEVLASKSIRWGLDAHEDDLIDWGKLFAKTLGFKDQYKDAK